MFGLAIILFIIMGFALCFVLPSYGVVKGIDHVVEVKREERYERYRKEEEEKQRVEAEQQEGNGQAENE